MPDPDRQPDDDRSDASGSSITGDARASEHADVLDVGAFIRNQRERAKLSVRRLAELADVSNPYLSQIERGLRRPSAEILQQIAKALKISVETLYIRAGILPDESTAEIGVREAIGSDRILTPEQKQALLNVYESFVAGSS